MSEATDRPRPRGRVGGGRVMAMGIVPCCYSTT